MPRDKFIPNDVQLPDDARLVILTGPNMAGKSTILRQVGLIVVLAQVGSFVPAARRRSAYATASSRAWARATTWCGDNPRSWWRWRRRAPSCTSRRARSLVLLDEIGRGTSTYDGVSIAWAVSEHLHNAVGCKTIFATHYHELVQLADELAAVRNYQRRRARGGRSGALPASLAAGRCGPLVRHRGRQVGGSAGAGDRSGARGAAAPGGGSRASRADARIGRA